MGPRLSVALLQEQVPPEKHEHAKRLILLNRMRRLTSQLEFAKEDLLRGYPPRELPDLVGLAQTITDAIDELRAIDAGRETAEATG